MQTRSSYLLIVATLVASTSAAFASDACSMRQLIAKADVRVSDGSAFAIEAMFQSADTNAIRHIDETTRTVAVEGPLSWIRRGSHEVAGEEAHGAFALGHQYHAFVLFFDELVSDLRTSEVEFHGKQHRAMSGNYRYGGTVHRVEGDAPARPKGLVVELPSRAPISVSFRRWRDAGGEMLPTRIRIEDGDEVYDYRYTKIELGDASPLWFFDTVPAPALDEVQIHRLHRKLLAAHCIGDADLIASLSASQTVVASRGELLRQSNEEIRTGFSGLFDRLDYTEYHDLVPPVIQVSGAGDIGWIAVNTRAVGEVVATGAAYDDQWAWVMMVRKADNRWVHVGNASNVTR